MLLLLSAQGELVAEGYLLSPVRVEANFTTTGEQVWWEDSVLHVRSPTRCESFSPLLVVPVSIFNLDCLGCVTYCTGHTYIMLSWMIQITKYVLDTMKYMPQIVTSAIFTNSNSTLFYIQNSRK